MKEGSYVGVIGGGCRVAETKIRFVKQMVCNDITYSWFVSMGDRVSDARSYSVYRSGRTVVEEFPYEDLPKAVRSFIEKREPELYSFAEGNNTFVTWIFEK